MQISGAVALVTGADPTAAMVKGALSGDPRDFYAASGSSEK
jgi:hypothetical protein